MAKEAVVNVLTVRYDAEISQKELPYFRGAVIASVGRDTDILFHNHHGDEKYRYSYPLVQYKRIGKKACVVFINDAISKAGVLLSNMNYEFQIGNRKASMSIEKVSTETCNLDIVDELKSYKIHNWLPLNADNFKRYMQMESMIERIELLQNILVGNIISMCKGLDIMMTDEIIVTFTTLSSPHTIEHKGIKLLSFDVDFKCNISLPNYIGIGKNASLGSGVIEKYVNLEDDRKKELKKAATKYLAPIFLLGGSDLEMVTIKRILTNHNCVFYDKKLTWSNALISSYSDIITNNPDRTIYAIELKVDTDIPDNVILIDHHNEKRQQASALEQVSNIFGTKLSRLYELVAANDKGYIPGMKEIDATEEEIAHIRLLDRHAQGVTEEEEEIAEYDVANVKKEGRLSIVITSLKHFSPIVDRLYPYDRLLVLADGELTYFGDGVEQLSNDLSSICSQIYYGGSGDHGYLGVSQAAPDVIENVKRIIIESKKC